MSREQWHDWGRYLLITVGIVFAGGGYVMKINTNTGHIEKNAVNIEEIKDDVHIIELNQRDEAATKQAILSTLNRLETETKIISVAQQRAVVNLTEIKGQVNNLIKDD